MGGGGGLKSVCKYGVVKTEFCLLVHYCQRAVGSSLFTFYALFLLSNILWAIPSEGVAAVETALHFYMVWSTDVCP